MTFLLVAALTFGATVALVLALTARKREHGTEELRDRVGRAKPGSADPSNVRIERDDRMSAVPFLDRALRGLSIARRVELLLYQAGMQMRVGAFLLLVAVGGLVGYVAAMAVFRHLLHGLVAGAIGASLPVLFVQMKKGSRRRAFAEEFPDALDLLVSALRAGI